MVNIKSQRCFNHQLREAVACCPKCNRFFCRECITEHEDQVLCASCLKKQIEKPPKSQKSIYAVFNVSAFLLGLLTVWLFFYLIGKGLVYIPSSFHEGTIWQVDHLESE